jgi:TerC family integral membrane protein
VLYVALGGLAVVLAGAYWLETRGAAAAAASPLRHALLWSVAWLALGLLPVLLFGLVQGSRQASAYGAVYLIERALSFDNVFVFAVLISAFEVPLAERERLVSWGALSAFVLRIPAILLGVALFDASHLVAYALGALLLVLAWQTTRASGPEAPGQSRIVALLQRRLPVAPHAGARLIVLSEGRRRPTPMLLCLIAIVFADITFAVDSIPAALAISHETTLLLTSNLLALLGLRAMYELVRVARERLRYMDETIAALLALVGLKLLAAELVQVGPLASLLGVLLVLGAGVAISLRAGAPAQATRAGAADDPRPAPGPGSAAQTSPSEAMRGERGASQSPTRSRQ